MRKTWNYSDMEKTKTSKTPPNTLPLSKIGEKQCVQHLGIMINNTLTFTDHITQVCNKSNQMCGWIQHICETWKQETTQTLWNSLVQTNWTTVASQLWVSHKIGEMQQLEVQRKYTGKIPTLSEHKTTGTD